MTTTWTRSKDSEGRNQWTAENGDHSAVVIEENGRFYGEGFVNRYSWIDGPWVDEHYTEPLDSLRDAQDAVSPFGRDEF